MTNRGHHLHAESHSSSCMLGSCSPITMSLLLNSAAKQSTHAFFPRVRFLVNLGTSMWPCRPWSSYPIADWRTALQFAMLGWSHWNPMHRAKANATKADESDVQKYWIRSSSTRMIRSETPSQHVMAFCLVLEWVNSCHGLSKLLSRLTKKELRKKEKGSRLHTVDAYVHPHSNLQTKCRQLYFATRGQVNYTHKNKTLPLRCYSKRVFQHLPTTIFKGLCHGCFWECISAQILEASAPIVRMHVTWRLRASSRETWKMPRVR